jgi:hypothetical protein
VLKDYRDSREHRVLRVEIKVLKGHQDLEVLQVPKVLKVQFKEQQDL